MQSRIVKKILTAVLSASLIIQMSIPMVFAEEQSNAEKNLDTTTQLNKEADAGTNIGVAAPSLDLSVPPTIETIATSGALTLNNATVPLIDGAVYGGDITSKGIILNEGIPTEVTQYKAGEGYVLFTPWSKSTSRKATIELNNATIDSMDKHSIVLPSFDVDLIIKGNNELYSNLSMKENSCIFGENTNLFVTGDGTLTATGKFSEIYGPPLLEGCGIRLVGNSKFIRDGNATYKLNLIAYTEYTDRKEQEVFGFVVQNKLPSDDANLIIFPNSQLTLQKPDGLGSNCEIRLCSKYLNICNNAKLIIDDEVCLNIEKDDKDVLPAVYNDGSILVKGVLHFRDRSYLKDIIKMNITTQERGVTVVDGHLIDTASGKAIFDEERGETLRKDNGGEWLCGEGSMKWEPVLDEQGELLSGIVTLNNVDISIKDSRSSAAIYIGAVENIPVTLNIIGNNTIENPYGAGIMKDNLILTGSGKLNGKGRMPIVYETKLDTSNFKGKLNTIAVKVVRDPSYGTLHYGTVYGTVSYYHNQEHFGYRTLTLENGSQLTIEPGAYLNANTLTNNGTIINNGTLEMLRDASDEELENWVYGNLNLKGNGIVKVSQAGGSAFALFTNEGKRINTSIDIPLDFRKATEDKGDLAKDGYHWDNQNKKLTLQNLIMWGNPSQDDFCAITFPEGVDVTLELKGYNKITGFKSAVYQGTYQMTEPITGLAATPVARGSLTICGDGTLQAEKQAYDSEHHESILTTTGKFILKSGNLILTPEGKSGLSSVGMEITGGSIGQKNSSAPIESFGSLTMSGGKVISGKGDGNSLTTFGDLTLSGGELITGDGFNSILVINGDVTVSGGKLTVYNCSDTMCNGITVIVAGNEDKKVSVSSGTLDIKAGISALSFMLSKGATGKGILETKGMTVTTNPAGGTLKSTTINIPSPNPEEKIMTVYALTADESLKSRGPELINACTSLTAVKTPSKPSNGGGSSGSHGGGGSSAVTTPTEKTNTSTLPTQEKAFADIVNHWAKDEIEFVTARGLFSGTGDGKFSPNMPMTRGMFVTVLGRLAKADVSSYKESSFADVKANAYYMAYIQWASKNGIVNGISATGFASDQSITREQMAVIMASYAKAIGFALPQVNKENTFADHGEISSYAREAVKQMQMAGILTGKNGNTFDPQGTATRAEVSAVLKRFAELVEKK